MDLKKAKENRKNFLAPYREKFKKAKTAKAKARIISELIGIESSHLSEPWIIKEVVAWLRDRDCLDFLEDVFIKARKKAVQTENQQRRAARDFYVVDDIDKIIKETGASVREACKILANRIYETDNQFYLLWDLADEDYPLEKAIRQVYNNSKEKPIEAYLPWPYYGRDVEVDENGKITMFGGR
jgi:hypothetical protein